MFKYEFSREGGLDKRRKNMAMEGKRKTQIRCIGQAFPCCGNISVRQEGGGTRSWQDLIAMLQGTDLIRLVAGLQQRLLSQE